MSHPRVELGSVAEFINGVAFKPSDWESEGRRIVRIQNLTDPTKPYNRTRRLVDEKYEIHQGDLLVSWSATLGVFVWEDEEIALVNQHIFKVEPDRDVIDPGYLRHMLTDALLEMERHLHGATMKHVNRKEFLATQIPVPHKNGKPDLDEQKRIAAILDKADAIRRKRQQALRLTDDFLRSVFLDMFGDPVTNPKGWDTDLLGNRTSLDAPMVNPDDPNFEKLLHYGPDRIEKNSGKLLPAQTAKEDGLISKKFLCDDRYLLYSKIRPYLNKVALVEEICLCSADVYPVRPADTSLTREFLWFLLRSRSFLRYAESCASRANIPKMNRMEFAAYEAILPPEGLQEKFSKLVKRTLKSFKTNSTASDASSDLFGSLQQRAFRGEL